MSQQKAADDIGISRPTLCIFLRGNATSSETLDKIVAWLGVEFTPD